MKAKARLAGGLLLVLAALGVVAVFVGRRAPEAPGRPLPREAPVAAPTPEPRPAASVSPAPAPAPASTPFVDSRTPAVDLERLRAELPDNLYWKTGSPTDDPDVLRERAEEDRRWNDLYGKVLSNTASEDEIHRYYDHRRRISEDAIQFATRVLQEFGDQLSEEEKGLYALSVRMHRTRLDEIPREISDALARKAAQDKRREEWLRTGR
jgi:hypothetical protein